MSSDNSKKIKGIIVDPNNKKEIDKIYEGDKIKRASIKKYLDNTVKINSDFIKIFTLNIMPIFAHLQDKKGKISHKTIELMFYLMRYISYTSGLLQFENGKPLTNKHIINELKVLSRTDIYNAVKILKDKGIISVVLIEDKNYYMFNPYLANRGSRIDKTHLHIFDKTIYKKNIVGGK